MTTESEHPVRNLLSRMLAALNAAEHLTTDAARRRFLNEWLNTACRDSGLHANWQPVECSAGQCRAGREL